MSTRVRTSESLFAGIRTVWLGSGPGLRARAVCRVAVARDTPVNSDAARVGTPASVHSS